MWFKFSGILILFLTSFSVFCQADSIVVDSIVAIEQQPKQTSSTIYIAGQVFNANRRFEDLSTSQKYDSISSQQATTTGGIEMGVQMNLNNHFYLSMGVNYFGGGEAWKYSDSLTDSTFSYINKYRQVAVPIRLNVHFGNKLKGYGFVGAIPSSILTRRYESSFSNFEGTETVNDIVSTEENINAFQFIGSIGGGVCYEFESVSLFAQIEYRHHFTNTYTGLFLSHKQNLLGGSVGLTYSF